MHPNSMPNFKNQPTNVDKFKSIVFKEYYALWATQYFLPINKPTRHIQTLITRRKKI